MVREAEILGVATTRWEYPMKLRMISAIAVLAGSLIVTSSAFAFDCIRVSFAHRGLVQSTSKSGNWLLFDFSSGPALQQTLARIGENVTADQAACLSAAYAGTGQPQFFALGIGVAGKNGVLAHNNPNHSVLGDNHGIDHLEDSPILAAADAAGEQCGVDVG
jgi:hypothetical protein